MYSKQSGFTYSAWEPFTKNKERTQKFKETGDTKYIFKNKFGKACFQHGMTDGGFKDLARKIASDKVLRDKASNFAKNAKHDGYQRGLASIVYDFFDKKYSGNGGNNEIKQNEQLADYQKILKKKSLVLI